MLIHLDHAAGGPLHPAVRAACAHALRDLCGNPSSLHAAGATARRALERAREQIAALLGASPDEIVLTSGATEANHLALALASVHADERPVLVTSAVEHPSVLAPAERLRRDGRRVERIPVSPDGTLDAGAAHVIRSLRPRMLSLQAANHETGVRMPWRALSTAAAEVGTLVHVDATQALGVEDVDVRSAPLDLLSGSGPKLHAPAGIGFLWARRGLSLAPIFEGGAQERGRRAGTPNLVGAVGLGVACDLARCERDDRARRLGALRDRLWAGLREKIPGARRHGSDCHVLPQFLNIGVEGVPAELLADALDLEGICASSGAACSSGVREPSPVLRAMGLDAERAREGLRLSLGPGNDEAEIDAVLRIVPDVVARIREASA